MDNYQKAVYGFYTLYFQHSKRNKWEHRVALNSYADNTIEVRKKDKTIIKVKDEDPENAWRRATDELKSWIERNEK